MNEAAGRLFACAVIVAVGSGVFYQACDRASSIYFFEMDSVITLFIKKYQAALFPMILSLFIYLVYWSTQRKLIVEEKVREQKLKLAKSVSRLGSRRHSISYATGDSTRRTSFSSTLYQDEPQTEQAKRLRRLLTAIEEQDTIQKMEEERKFDIPKSETTSKAAIPTKFQVEKVPEGLRAVSDPVGATRNRVGSFGQRLFSEKDEMVEDLPKELVDDVVEDVEYHNPYQRLIELDPTNYAWNLISFSPTSYNEEGWHLMDILSEFVAVHIPIWGCTVALYIVLLETMNIKLPYFFYYHGSLFAYGALLCALSCGLFHEIKSNWLTNDILALSSIYVIVSRFQVVSYQAGVIFVVGVVAADLFWFLGVDLISTCLKNKKAPIFVMFPRDFQGTMEVVTTTTFVIPAVFTGIVLKYGSMYDIHLYHNTFYSIVTAISIQLALDICRNIKIPGLVLPSVTALAASMIFAHHRQDLWRFMIKH